MSAIRLGRFDSDNVSPETVA